VKYFSPFVLLAALATSGHAQPLVVGAVVSETGAHAEAASGYRNALLLWQEEISAAGGLLGRPVELRLLDDASEAIQTGQRYEQLIREGAAALIGPYGSAATLMAVAQAESARRVLVNGAGWSGEVHKRAPRFVFQSAIPYKAYGTGLLELARERGYRRLFILAHDDIASREMAAATLAEAVKLGLAVGEVRVYPAGTVEFAPYVTQAKAADADAWIEFGQARDAVETVKTFKKLGYAPKLFSARGITDPKFIAAVGQDAEFALGPKAYDTRFATPANQKFVEAYTAKWAALPGPAAAEGYAAATVLAEGVRRAGTADAEKLRAALASLTTTTVLGEFKVDPATGEQRAEKPVLVQILKGHQEIVWPKPLETAERVLPYPPWSVRTVRKK
jgi:branched-chain amino acid transport system substrate-binding protein